MSRKHGGRTSRQRLRDAEEQARTLEDAERVGRRRGKGRFFPPRTSERGQPSPGKKVFGHPDPGQRASFLGENKRSERPAQVSLPPKIPDTSRKGVEQ